MNGNIKELKCVKCGWDKNCEGLIKTECLKYDYELFITKADKELCDLICPPIEFNEFNIEHEY